MEVYNNELVEIDLKESFYFLLHKLWLIGIVGILFAVCTALVNVYLLPPVYTSTSKIYMISQQRDDELTVANSGTGSQLTNDSIKLVKDRAVMERVIQELKLDLSPDELDQRVNVDIAQDSSAIEINVVYSNPIMAKKIVDTIAKTSLEQLIQVVETERVIRIEEGILPTVPFNPNLRKKVFLGAVCGILFSIAFLALGHRPNGSVQNIEYIEQCVGRRHSVFHSLRMKLIERRKESSVR